MKWTHALRLLAVVGSAGALGAACLSGSLSASARPLTTVRFSEVIRSVFYAPQYVAMAKGMFAAKGLDVKLTTAEGSDKGAAALLAGTADISLIGPETAIYVNGQHGTTALKSFYQLTDTDGSFLMSRQRIPHFTWSDLRGKTVISWRPGSDPQMVLAQVIADHRVPGVNVVTNISATAMVGAFESGRGDFIQVYEPVVATLEQSGQAYYDASLGAAIGDYPETAYMATAGYIRSHPAVLQAFCDAVYHASRWIATHSPETVARAISPYFPGTPVSQLAASIRLYEGLHTWRSPLMSGQQLRMLEDVLIRSRTVPSNRAIPYSDVFVPTFAMNAMRQN